ncbi:hypothetical protein Tco_1318179 [Tanacetum coccineum]
MYVLSQYCAMGLGWFGLDFRGFLSPLFEEAVINLFFKNMNTTLVNFQVYTLHMIKWEFLIHNGSFTKLFLHRGAGISDQLFVNVPDARASGVLKQAKDKLEKHMEELTLRLQLKKRLRLEVFFNGGKVSNYISNAAHFVIMSIPWFHVEFDTIVKSNGQMKSEQDTMLAQAQQHIAMHKMALQIDGFNLPGAGVGGLLSYLNDDDLFHVKVVSAEDLLDDGEYEDILEDMREGGGKFVIFEGDLTNVVIPRPNSNGDQVHGLGKEERHVDEPEQVVPSVVPPCKSRPFNLHTFGATMNPRFSRFFRSMRLIKVEDELAEVDIQYMRPSKTRYHMEFEEDPALVGQLSDAAAEAARFGYTAVDRPEGFLVLAIASLGYKVTELTSPPELVDMEECKSPIAQKVVMESEDGSNTE